jgi:hypothetical protein
VWGSKTAAGLVAGFRAAQLVSRVVYVSFVRDIFPQLQSYLQGRDRVPLPSVSPLYVTVREKLANYIHKFVDLIRIMK